MSKRLTALVALPVLALSAACSAGANGPDEFRVVTKAPLVVPPDYSLRPPPVGEARPSELNPENIDRAVAFGQQIGVNASAGEQVLVARANAVAVSPVIRSVIDYEEAGILRKNTSTADRVLDWEGTDEERAQAESDNATGGGDVVIEKGRTRLKLPGT